MENLLFSPWGPGKLWMSYMQGKPLNYLCRKFGCYLCFLLMNKQTHCSPFFLTKSIFLSMMDKGTSGSAVSERRT